MTEMINFGIDLGTTNSLVAKFNKGIVEVFKDPRHQGIELLPSVVGFRDDRILIGQQAKYYAEKDQKNVKSRFKRKMGTTESFRIMALDQSKTPIELSAFILKELKTFIHTGEVPEAVVITTPASFDMVQCHATEEAGYVAGFKQVVLLQEPIAASLAYANKETGVDLRNSQWIVYDLGGGTFDVALVKILEGELKIVDHEGDNYLGGTDFDALIVEKLIVPYLEERGKFTNLLQQMKSATGRYNWLRYFLLNQAEQAKIELSTRHETEIDLSRISVEDENGIVIDDNIKITCSEYENLIKDAIDYTADMLNKILTRNSLRPHDLNFVLMVGGSTYTPFVRKRIEELLSIPINTGIDPTNAIVIGAAYFAATKEINLSEKSEVKPDQTGLIKIKVSYNRASKDLEEIFSAKVIGNVEGLFYRITREDGGYDSGLKKLSPRITEDLTLQEDTYNLFTFKIYDEQNNPVSTNVESIQIYQGYPSEQMLPADLSLVKDVLSTGDTKLERIFIKSSVLPTRKKMMVEASKTIRKGSSDKIRIMVVEGPSENHFSVNKPVGTLMIPGNRLKQDLLRGTTVDLTFELSESRILTVTAYINPNGPEYKKVFTPTYRKVEVDILFDEVQMLCKHLEEEKNEALSHDNNEVAENLDELSEPVEKLHDEVMILTLTPDDDTDDRYKIQDRKRKIAQELYKLTAGKQIERLRVDYLTTKNEVTEIVNESGNDIERQQLHEIITREHTFLNSTNPKKLEAEIDHLHYIRFQILRRSPDFLEGWFHHLIERRETFDDQVQAINLIEAGNKYLDTKDYDKLTEVNIRLHSLLPQQEQDSKEMRYFTGIN